MNEIDIKTVGGKTTYNGYESMYEALLHSDPDFKDLNFANRVLATALVLNDIENPEPEWTTFEPKSWVYSFAYVNDQYHGVVYDPDNSHTDPIFTSAGDELFEEGIMKDEYDLEGLFKFLVKSGDLLPEDNLYLIHGLKSQFL